MRAVGRISSLMERENWFSNMIAMFLAIERRGS